MLVGSLQGPAGKQSLKLSSVISSLLSLALSLATVLPSSWARWFGKSKVGPCSMVGLVGPTQSGSVLPVPLQGGVFLSRGSCAAPCRATLTG